MQPTSAASRVVSLAGRILRIQVLFAAGACALAALFGADAATSAAWGALSAVATTWWFSRRVFAPVPRGDRGVFAGAMLGAEIVRLVTAGVSFAGAYALLARVEPLALVGAFLVVHLGATLAVLGEGVGAEIRAEDLDSSGELR